MKRNKLILLVCFMLFMPWQYLLAENLKAASNQFTHLTRVCIAEAYNLNKAISGKIWKNWHSSVFPVKIITDDYEFLINHPNPSPGFSLLKEDELLKAKVFYKPRTYFHRLIATVEKVSGVDTVVISNPEEFKSDFKEMPTFFKDEETYIIYMVHENFHIYQKKNWNMQKRLKNLEKTVGIKKVFLSYPYSDEIHLSQRKTESLILKDALELTDKFDLKMALSKFMDARKRRRLKMLVNLGFSYGKPEIHFEKFQEWLEGSARYTEVRISDFLMKGTYKPISEFTKLPDFNSYNIAKKWLSIEKNKLGKIRGGDVHYNSGFAMIFLLDKFDPNLKELLANEGVFPEDLIQQQIFR